MFTRLFVLFTVVSVSLGVLGRLIPLPSPALSANPDSVPVILTARSSPVASPELLDQSIERLKSITWLRTTVWQRRYDARIAYESEGKLLRGLNHTARLEGWIRTGDGEKLTQLIVSDSSVLAERLRYHARPPLFKSYVLPAREVADPQKFSPLRESFLTQRNCGGPLSFVQELRDVLTDLEISEGTHHQREVTVLKGKVNLEHARMQAKRSVRFAPERCLIYIDPGTLWPLRIEWYGKEGVILETEFRDAVIDQALTYDECVAHFTMPKAE